MGLKKRISLPSAHAGIMGGSLTPQAESLFMISPVKFIVGITILAVVIKLLHLLIG